MKKIITLLISALFIYGCGSGGGDTTSSIPSGGGGTSGAGVTKTSFTLKIVDSSASLAKTTALTTVGTAQTPTDIRVVVRRTVLQDVTVPVLDGDGNPTGETTIIQQAIELYKDIQDFGNAGSVTIGIPVGVGYTAEVITSKLEGTNHSILKYGKSANFDVTPASDSATVPISDISTVINMTVPDATNSKTKYTGAYNGGYPFSGTSTRIRQDLGLPTFANFSSNKSFGGNNFNFTAYEVLVPNTGSAYVTGRFFLHSSLLKQGESLANWSRIYPNHAYGEFVYTVITPSIGIEILVP